MRDFPDPRGAGSTPGTVLVGHPWVSHFPGLASLPSPIRHSLRMAPGGALFFCAIGRPKTVVTDTAGEVGFIAFDSVFPKRRCVRGNKTGGVDVIGGARIAVRRTHARYAGRAFMASSGCIDVPNSRALGPPPGPAAARPVEEPVRLPIGAYGEHAGVYFADGLGGLVPAPSTLGAGIWEDAIFYIRHMPRLEELPAHQ